MNCADTPTFSVAQCEKNDRAKRPIVQFQHNGRISTRAFTHRDPKVPAAGKDYFSTRSRRVLPGLKWTYFFAGMVIVAPVAGLRP